MANQVSTQAAPVLRHYVIWAGKGINDLSGASVPSRDPAQYKLKPGADSFRFYDVLELDVEVDGEVVRFNSEPRNYSPFYVPGGHFLTGEDRDVAFERHGQALPLERDKYLVIRTRYRVVFMSPEELEGTDVEFPPLA